MCMYVCAGVCLCVCVCVFLCVPACVLECGCDIFFFYLNRLTVNEDDQFEVISVVDVECWDSNPNYLNEVPSDDEDSNWCAELQIEWFNQAVENKQAIQHSIKQELFYYEDQVKKGFVREKQRLFIVLSI